MRKRYPYYGKKKLKVLYEKEYCDEISTWKIERVIRRGCPKTRISAGRDDLNAKEKRVIIGDKREE